MRLIPILKEKGTRIFRVFAHCRYIHILCNFFLKDGRTSIGNSQKFDDYNGNCFKVLLEYVCWIVPFFKLKTHKKTASILNNFITLLLNMFLVEN